jgi:CBS domain-containing protein/ribosome-associated translation inhibitor RaiA
MPIPWPTAADLMTPRPVTLPPDAPISQALGLMRSKGFHEIPVMRRGRMIGMITFESIARRSSRPLATKVEHLLILPPLITPTTPYPELVEHLLAAGLRAAPVVGRRGEILGIVSRTDLVRALPELPQVLGDESPPVEAVARSANEVVQEDELCRHLLTRVRVLEEHPLPVVDRKGRLVGAVGVSDLGKVLWKPVTGGKRDARANRSVLDVSVGSIMHAPPVTVTSGASTRDAALLMIAEGVSSVFVVEDRRPTGILGQSDLLGLVVGRARPVGPKGRVEDVYVEITGLRGSGDPVLFAEIDDVVARGLHRVARYVQPSLLSLHFSPHATHRTNDLTVEARLHTNHGIFYASHTGWNLLAGVAGLLEDLAGQTRRIREESRSRRRPRGGASSDSEGNLLVDGDLERRIRAATRADDDEE